jgi:hypothetical protein
VEKFVEPEKIVRISGV